MWIEFDNDTLLNIFVLGICGGISALLLFLDQCNSNDDQKSKKEN